MIKIVLECIIVPFIFVDKFHQKLPVHPLICPSISYGRKKIQDKSHCSTDSLVLIIHTWYHDADIGE